mmetsp:Transcript_44415/g.96540  ORF Transcript_44415/g.96540 Transcript_44415/m.96540 type:complete len:203 (+) Transcript_44415:65-673(+)
MQRIRGKKGKEAPPLWVLLRALETGMLLKGFLHLLWSPIRNKLYSLAHRSGVQTRIPCFASPSGILVSINACFVGTRPALCQARTWNASFDGPSSTLLARSRSRIVDDFQQTGAEFLLVALLDQPSMHHWPRSRSGHQRSKIKEAPAFLASASCRSQNRRPSYPRPAAAVRPSPIDLPLDQPREERHRGTGGGCTAVPRHLC